MSVMPEHSGWREQTVWRLDCAWCVLELRAGRVARVDQASGKVTRDESREILWGLVGRCQARKLEA